MKENRTLLKKFFKQKGNDKRKNFGTLIRKKKHAKNTDKK